MPPLSGRRARDRSSGVASGRICLASITTSATAPPTALLLRSPPPPARAREGFGRFVVNEKNGERCSAATAYLAPALERPNLDVLQGALVHRVALATGGAEEAVGPCATGVEFSLAAGDDAAAPATRTARLAAGGEVLLAGGAINSPQLLQLSGVGAKDELAAHGIACAVDAPARDPRALLLFFLTRLLLSKRAASWFQRDWPPVKPIIMDG